MTSRATARVAGVAFIVYIVVGLVQLAVAGETAAGANGAAETLARYATHLLAVRVSVLLLLVEAMCAMALGASLYVLTQEVDRFLALFALLCRACEGVINAMGAVHELGVLRIATSVSDATPVTDSLAAAVLSALPNATISATCFAMGSALFAWLFVRSRSIPPTLAWLGVASSVLLVVMLPLQLLGFARGMVLTAMWMPMLVFEVWLAVVLIMRGIAAPAP